MQAKKRPEQPYRPVSSSRGRPRDPNIEDRVFDAALALYGDQGWPGFNFDAVAKRAGVGKDALYRRWDSREILLREALDERWEWLRAIDEGSLREDLIALGRTVLNTFAGPFGSVALQLRADAHRYVEVRAFADPYRETVVRQGRSIVRRAIERGGLPAGTNPGLIMDLLIGGIINHILSTPDRLRHAMMQQADRFIEDSVDVILGGTNRLVARLRISD